MAVSPRQAQIAANAQPLDKQFAGLNKGAPGGDWGGAYTRYMAVHPLSDPDAVFSAVEQALSNAEAGIGALPKTIAAAVAAVGKATGQITKGTGKGLELPSFLSFLSGLTSRDLWVRIAKVVIGAAMIMIGVAELAGSSKALSNVKVIPV